MIVVSNTTPLIGLARIERFDLLRQIFGEIVIAQAVYDEAVVAGCEKGGARREVLAAAGWLRVKPVCDRLAVEVLLDELDLGEAETIVLAREMGADWVLMDEKRGRRKLDQLGLHKMGVGGLLLLAKQQGLLAQVGSELERLCRCEFSLSPAVVVAILKEADEYVEP